MSLKSIESVGYVVVTLLVLRLAVGHFAYSYTLAPAEADRTWNNRSWRPYVRQDGTKPPAWFPGAWRGTLLALLWPLVLTVGGIWILTSRVLSAVPLYVGNERRARMVERQRLHAERCRDVDLPPT